MDAFDSYGRSPADAKPAESKRTESFERDTYNRDRNRDTYRDRRRSPGPRLRGGRARSRSPAQIDRYQPDRDRDDRYNGRPREDMGRNRRRSSPQAPPNIDRYVPGEDSAMPRPLPVNALRDPLLENTQVGFSYFAEWWKAEQEIRQQKEWQKNGGRRAEQPKESFQEMRAKIQAAYDQYKLNWNTRMAKLFVHAHKYDTWFRERYVTEVREPLRQRVAEHKRGLFDLWQQDVENGVFDDFTMEGIYKSESNGAGGIVEKEEGETIAAAEVMAVSDLVPAKGGDMRDPVASLPTLLIKTITPAVSRDKLEEFCKEHLGEGEGGFKWLSLSDPNPGKKFHRLGWIMLNPSPEQAAEEPARRGAGDAEDEEGAMDEDQPSGLLTICEKALDQINNKTVQDPEKGDFTVHVGIHRPAEAPRKKALWDLFSAPERVERDLELALRLVTKIDEDAGFNGLAKIEERVGELAGKGWLQPPLAIAAETDKPEAGEDDDMEEGEEEEAAVKDDDDENDDEEMLIKKKKLDLLVEYLRRVHNFCFYCVFETDSVHELQRKCAGGHLRRPRASLTTAAKEVARASAAGLEFPDKKKDAPTDNDVEGSPVEERKNSKNFGAKNQLQKAFNWVKTFEEKLYQVLEPENIDLKKLGGQPVEEGLDEELKKFVKQEDEQKFRCKAPECTKLFKGLPFWRKHVEKRHAEWYDTLKGDIELINRYVLDPARLAQGRNDAASNGHFPLNNSMMTGTPRNFSLNNMAFNGNSFMANSMVGAPPVFNPFMGPHAGVMPQGWGMPGADHGIGPMRNGMRMSGARAPGPYDRGARRSVGGRLSPPRGGPGARGGRGMFMEGGVGTFGSSQAVEGRTMKSYNDLDAAAGGDQGGGELNY